MICSSKYCYFNYAKEITNEEKKLIQEIYCNNCKTTKYCSERCRDLDWLSNHKNICKQQQITISPELDKKPVYVQQQQNLQQNINNNGNNTSFSNLDSVNNQSYQSSFVSTSSKSTNQKSLIDYEIVTLPNKKNELGHGSYGSVRLVKEKQNQKLYAMKVMNKKTIFEYCTVENLKREIKIQKRLQHPHITKLYHYFEDKDNVYLVLEYAENGSLFHFLRKKKHFSEFEAFVYFFQTCLGIDYLHKKNIIHRDLKPENLLLDSNGNIKLCDFGWSAESMSNLKRTTFCGTIDYMAPEMLKNEPHDHSLDIWCLGILLYELIHGFAPFRGSNDKEKCNNIVNNAQIQYDLSITQELKDLIIKILRPNPQERLSMNSIFTHPWMQKMEKVYKIDIQQYIYRPGQEKQDERRQISPSSTSHNNASINNNSLLNDSQNMKKDCFKSISQNNIHQDNYQVIQQQDNKKQQNKINQDRQQYQLQQQKTNEDIKIKKPESFWSDKQQQQPYSSQHSQDLELDQLKKSKFELDSLLESSNYRQRVSRVSQRNNQIEINEKRLIQQKNKKEEEGFIDKILHAFGCINRDNKEINKK